MSGSWNGVRLFGFFLRLRQLAILVALAILGVVSYHLFRVPREPVYQGKPLSAWLQTYNPASPSNRGSPAWKATDDALSHIGTNAIPFLLKSLRARDSSLKLRLVAWAQKQHLIKIHFVPAAERNIQASRAFIVLGNTAKDATPDLIKAYEETEGVEARSAIEDVFAWVGPDARPALPLLLRAATNSNNRVRANALWALGEIRAEPNSCVPALLQGLNDPDPWVQTSAAHALGMFGPDASAAIPALAQFAQPSGFSRTHASFTSTAQVDIEARRALRKIAPGSASSTNGNPSAWDTSDPASLLFPQ
jgi:hypothetical protein